MTYLKTILWAILRRPLVANTSFVGRIRLAPGTRNALIAGNHFDL